MMLSILQEKRPLKRSRLGPPDVYPQEAKQREDELTPTNVKHGFATTPPLSDEFGTAHNSNVNANKVGAFFNSILLKKEELMTLQDTVRKKQQINCKDNFWPVSPRTKSALDAWFKDLAGNKPLLSLAKKAPSFNKKEEIFITLCDNQVNMQRATWFIKLSAAYTLSFTESKNKKRSIYDPAAEWTNNMIKFMKELIPKLQDFYNQQGSEKGNSTSSSNISANPITVAQMSLPSPTPISSPANIIPAQNNMSSSFIGNGSTVTSGGIQVSSPVSGSISGTGSNFEDNRNALKYWKYCTQLSKYMQEEALLDRQEFLNWIIELLEKMCSQTSFVEGLKKLLLTFALQYMHDFVQSERLSRKLSYVVVKNLSHLLYLATEQQQLKRVFHMGSNADVIMESEVTENNKKRVVEPYDSALNEYLNCPHHRDIILNLSTILQIITIECPTAMVWSGILESRLPSVFCGSPLDHLPVVPSSLPMPHMSQNTHTEIRRQLLMAEAEIALRSKHAENHWFAEKWINPNTNSYPHVLHILDQLDSHCFERLDQNNSIDALYMKIFSPLPAMRREVEVNNEKTFVYDCMSDALTVKILCEWAVSNKRWGDHRAIVVAILLDKRQIDATSAMDMDQCHNNSNNGNDDKDSVASGMGLISGMPVFQSVLMDFLDNDAPVLDENGTLQNRTQFINLVHLFSALIRFDVFSHNAYMHTLISRGDLLTETTPPTCSFGKTPTTGTPGTSECAPKPPKSPPHNFEDEFTSTIDFKHSEFDDSNVDDDLDKLLQNIKEKGQQNALEAPDSPKIVDSSNTDLGQSRISRHYIYTKHFPIPQDDASLFYSSETNQRYILLFGVGKERDEKKHAVKKMSKEICKLFSKKFCIDVAEGGKVKKHSRNEFNFEATTTKCQNMAYFDQHVITSQCAATVLEQLNSFAMGNSSYLPVQEHVAFLFDLMEMALNIYSLLELCDQILKELPEIENQLQAKKSNMSRSYTTSLALYIVGILRRYHSCLLLSPDQTSSMFDGLCKTVKHVKNPKECSSAERCIFAYLSDLFESCVCLKSKEQFLENFQLLTIIKSFKDILNSPEQLSAVPQTYNPQFMQDLFSSPKRGGKIDPLWLRQIQESPSNVYSFVSNAILAVCRETDNDRLNDIAISCAELTAGCNALSEEWIAALQSICNATKKPRYPHLCGQVNIHSTKVHSVLSVFICILVARNCFSLADFVLKFALPTLAYACPDGGEFTKDTEAGACLTCHLVLKLFKTIEIPQPGMYSVSTSPNPISVVGNSFNIKLSCDRHLLVGAHKNIPIQAVLAVIKAILIVVDLKTPTCSLNSATTFGSGKRSGFNTPVHPGSTPKSNERPTDLSQILGTSDLSNLGMDLEPELPQAPSISVASVCEQVSLLEFANHVLKQICSQEHVLERCLKHADNLCEMIIDDMLTAKQVQRVLYMICYPEAEYNIISEMDQRSMIVRILQNLGQWTLRISWLDLELMYRQSMNSPVELNTWLDSVARAAIDIFQIEEVTPLYGSRPTTREKPSTWLIAPLVSKLTAQVQGRILRVAGCVLESMKYFSKLPRSDNSCSESGQQHEKINICGNILSSYNITIPAREKKINYQPFLSLILTCLNGQDEYKESLLVSLHSQLSHYLQSFSEFDTVGCFYDPQGREDMLDALRLRFSLVGGMFDTIQKNGTFTTDWAILLAQLICQGVIDLSYNRELFTTVVDMLTTLVHSTLSTENQNDRDENKKLYLNLIKKLKKEIGERNNASIKIIRQLLPLYKQTTEVISCEPACVDMKGNKICDIDKKQLRISDKQRISVWDILEGHKNPAPLSWVWFGAVKLERKPLAYEENHRTLKYHTHSLMKPASYYYEPLPLPPEEIEPVPEKIYIKDELKADTPSSVDQSPSATTTSRARGKGTNRKRKPKNPKTPPVNIQAHLQVSTQQQQQQSPPAQPQATQNHINNQNQLNQMQMSMQVNIQQYASNQILQQNTNAIMQQQQITTVQGNLQQQMANNSQNNQVGFMNNGTQGMAHAGGHNQQQWPGQNQYHPMQPQFYQQQNMQVNRFERPQLNQSKQALCNMLRQRQPTFNQNNANFTTIPQQQRPTQNLQAQQPQSTLNSVPQQQHQFARNAMRVMASNQNQMASTMNPVNMGQSSLLQHQVPTQNMNASNALQTNQSMAMAQNTGMMNVAPTSQTNMMTSQNNSGMVAGNAMMQQGLGVPGNNGLNVNQGMVNQGPNQFQTFNQYPQAGLNQNNGAGQAQQSNIINVGFNHQRNNSNDFMQQRNAGGMANNRGQFINQVPNVTMNNMNQAGQSYSRQQAPGGKPSMVASQQQFQQQQRLHHQIMQMHGGGNVGGMPQQGQNITQQTPNLVAQLQRQMNPQNMLGQQYQHQPPPY